MKQGLFEVVLLLFRSIYSIVVTEILFNVLGWQCLAYTLEKLWCICECKWLWNASWIIILSTSFAHSLSWNRNVGENLWFFFGAFVKCWSSVIRNGITSFRLISLGLVAGALFFVIGLFILKSFCVWWDISIFNQRSINSGLLKYKWIIRKK